MTHADAVEVGVVHPKWLYSHGFELSLTRIRVRNWPVLGKKLLDSEVETYALFGPFDLLCRHYRTIGYRIHELLAEYNISETLFGGLDSFNVSSIDKFEGFDLDWEKAASLEPSVEVLQTLDDLQQDWNTVPRKTRDEFIKNNVIFAKPVLKKPGTLEEGIRAFIFIGLPVATGKELELYRSFLKLSVFQQWWDNVCGLFWGSSDGHYNCVAEVVVPTIQDLIRFIMDHLQNAIPGGEVETSTHIVIGSTRSLQVPISKIFKNRPVDHTLTLFNIEWTQITELLAESNWQLSQQLVSIPERSRIRCVALYDQLAPIINSIMKNTDDPHVTPAVMTALASTLEGVVLSDSRPFGTVGTTLGPCIERIFRGLLGKRAFRVFEGKPQELQETLKVKTAKKGQFPDQLTGGEVANAIATWNKTFPQDPLLPDALLTKWKSFRWLRDQASHARSVDFDQAIGAILDGFTTIQFFLELHSDDKEKYDYSYDV